MCSQRVKGETRRDKLRQDRPLRASASTRPSSGSHDAKTGPTVPTTCPERVVRRAGDVKERGRRDGRNGRGLWRRRIRREQNKLRGREASSARRRLYVCKCVHVCVCIRARGAEETLERQWGRSRVSQRVGALHYCQLRPFRLCRLASLTPANTRCVATTANKHCKGSHRGGLGDVERDAIVMPAVFWFLICPLNRRDRLLPQPRPKLADGSERESISLLAIDWLTC